MKILFMCVGNSARSQIAEALAKQLFGSKADIRSAGSMPTTPNPHAIRVIAEQGADVTKLASKSVADLPDQFISELDYVITLCAEEVCPVVFTKAKKLHWPLPDPVGQHGSDEEQLQRFRQTCDQIRKRLEIFLKDASYKIVLNGPALTSIASFVTTPRWHELLAASPRLEADLEY